MHGTIGLAAVSSSTPVPLALFFWGYVAAYVVHILDESVLGESFVGMVQRHFWPGYGWKQFFWFNAGLMSLIVGSIVLHEELGGAWVILPLVFVFQMFTNGLWHLGATVLTRRYSPGLLTSVLYWLLLYLMFRYGRLGEAVRTGWLAAAAVGGTLVTVVMIGSLFVIRRSAWGEALRVR